MIPNGISNILNRYGDWTTLNKVKYWGGYVAIPYTNADRSKVVVTLHQPS